MWTDRSGFADFQSLILWFIYTRFETAIRCKAKSKVSQRLAVRLVSILNLDSHCPDKYRLNSSDDDWSVVLHLVLPLPGINKKYDAGDEEDGKAEPGEEETEAELVLRVRGIGSRQMALLVVDHSLEDFNANKDTSGCKVTHTGYLRTATVPSYLMLRRHSNLDFPQGIFLKCPAYIWFYVNWSRSGIFSKPEISEEGVK